MIRRFFYTCPISAAFMAKHFGMKMAIPEGEQGWTVNELIIAFQMDVPIYIYPDSEKLLKVELGDVVSMTKAMDRYAAVKGEQFREAFEETSDYKIIQRNGIPFMWPESGDTAT